MIIFYSDVDAEMTVIEKDGEAIFEGNFWDLPQDPEGLQRLLSKMGFEVQVKPYEYN